MTFFKLRSYVGSHRLSLDKSVAHVNKHLFAGASLIETCLKTSNCGFHLTSDGFLFFKLSLKLFNLFLAAAELISGIFTYRPFSVYLLTREVKLVIQLCNLSIVFASGGLLPCTFFVKSSLKLRILLLLLFFQLFVLWLETAEGFSEWVQLASLRVKLLLERLNFGWALAGLFGPFQLLLVLAMHFDLLLS